MVWFITMDTFPTLEQVFRRRRSVNNRIYSHVIQRPPLTDILLVVHNQKHEHPSDPKTNNAFHQTTVDSTNHLIYPNIQTNYKDWSFRSKRNCSNLEIKPQTVAREKLILKCDSNPPKILKLLTTSSTDIETVKFGNKCLGRLIDHWRTDARPVPNVVHYVWYAERELEFFQFLSFMSVIRFVKPSLILLHGDYVPYGRYWDYFISKWPNVVHVKRKFPTHVFGQKLAYPEHGSDVMRIEALLEYGGIYLDWDEIILRPLESLRRYDCTLGNEMDGALACSFIMSKKNATFLTYWHHGYRKYTGAWTENSMSVPYKLAQRYPNLIHIEGNLFTKPNWENRSEIFQENYDWTTNYGMHLFIRAYEYKNETDVNVIRKLNTTIGAVSRHVLLGNKELCIE